MPYHLATPQYFFRSLSNNYYSLYCEKVKPFFEKFHCFTSGRQIEPTKAVYPIINNQKINREQKLKVMFPIFFVIFNTENEKLTRVRYLLLALFVTVRRSYLPRLDALGVVLFKQNLNRFENQLNIEQKILMLDVIQIQL